MLSFNEFKESVMESALYEATAFKPTTGVAYRVKTGKYKDKTVYIVSSTGMDYKGDYYVYEEGKSKQDQFIVNASALQAPKKVKKLKVGEKLSIMINGEPENVTVTSDQMTSWGFYDVKTKVGSVLRIAPTADGTGYSLK